MPRDFLPGREADLVIWSTNFKNIITAEAASLGLTPAQATAYGLKHDQWVADYQLARDPSTRTPSAVISKDLSKSLLAAEARLLARIIQATPTVSPTQKSDLGLTVRDTDPSPIPPPAVAPSLLVRSVATTTVRVRLVDDANPTRRGKPAGVAGASVFSFVATGGATPPADLSAWTFEGNATRTTVDVAFPAATPAGTKVYLRAFWFNPRGQAGPACDPVGTNLPGVGATTAQAA